MRCIATTLAVVVALLFSTGSAWADLDDAKAAAQRGDLATALKELRPLAEQGVPIAQFQLGNMYRLGKGIPKDDAKAVKWWRKAAGRGFADAQYNLGIAYEYGHGVPVNDAEAVKWYRKAAEQGFAKAQANLGAMYYFGEGVSMNSVKAYMWWSFAMEQGDESATKNLNIIKEELSSAEISIAQELSIEMWEKINN